MIQKTKHSKGFLIVCSKNRLFYVMALNLLDSIKTFYPEAKVCLVSEERFLDGGEKNFDDVIICDDHRRAKIWGMYHTPYDQTFYIDADTEVIHKDISTVFDKFDDKDILFTVLPEDRSYCYSELFFPGGRFWYCGAVCLYDTTKPLVREFVKDWFDLTNLMYAEKWWPKRPDNDDPDYMLYPPSLRRWDQFSLWWLLNKEPKYSELKHGRLDGNEDARWNHYLGYYYKHCENSPIIEHYSGVKIKSTGWREFEK